MLKLKNLVLAVIAFGVISCSNKNTKKEPQWQSLFNGKDLEGWVPKFYHHDLGDNYANTFRVKDGAIQVNYDGYTEFNDRYGHLFFNKSFSSYHLKFEYRFTDQWMKDAASYTYRNSGVMFHSQDPKTILKEQNWPISVEYQILAEETEGVSRPTGNMCSPGTEVFVDDKMDPRHCVQSTSKTYKWNEWVKGELIVYSDSLVIHKVNGKEVLKYTKPQIGGGTANGFDPKIKIDGKPLTEGYIGLQAEGQGVEFREIKIKEFL
ncbi:3-keto-disaccharide hydrolase [Aureibaculum conchae]|uniref:3-keto-disaccharide hydrolase n=1 Tax=Aureibaculum sp. 2308TA14-22 TaxID=3108392 RepID=UPI003396A186